MNDLLFNQRLTVPVTDDLREAVRKAADQNGLTVADYLRVSIDDALTRDGIPFRRLPLLHRPAPSKKAGG
jgi:antitoxin component of RelBE/YafQ-DinJ toxin-antitoxin module